MASPTASAHSAAAAASAQSTASATSATSRVVVVVVSDSCIVTSMFRSCPYTFSLPQPKDSEVSISMKSSQYTSENQNTDPPPWQYIHSHTYESRLEETAIQCSCFVKNIEASLPLFVKATTLNCAGSLVYNIHARLDTGYHFGYKKTRASNTDSDTVPAPLPGLVLPVLVLPELLFPVLVFASLLLLAPPPSILLSGFPLAPGDGPCTISYCCSLRACERREG